MEIKKSKKSDTTHISKHLRETDRKEIRARFNNNPRKSLLNGLYFSKPSAFSATVDNYPAYARRSDIDHLHKNMREADLAELRALGEKSPKDALKRCCDNSRPRTYSGIVKEVPVAMFGIVPFADESKLGSIWLLGTDEIDKNPISFLRWSRKFFPTLIEPYDLVCNIVDKRNLVHIKWLEWLGFSFIQEIITGPENRPFYEFAKVK